MVMPFEPKWPESGTQSTLAFPQTVLRVLWIALVVVLSLLMLYRFGAFSQGTETPVDIAVLLIWVALLVAPLFNEVDIFGVRLTREIGALREEVREQISAIGNEVRNSNVVRSEVSPSFVFGSSVSDADLNKLAERLVSEIGRQTLPTPPHGAGIREIPQSTQFLFATRYAIERELNRLALLSALTTPDGRYYPPTTIAGRLTERGLLNRTAYASLREVLQICNGAIHGVEPSEAQVHFVEKTAPELVALLRSIEPLG